MFELLSSVTSGDLSILLISGYVLYQLAQTITNKVNSVYNLTEKFVKNVEVLASNSSVIACSIDSASDNLNSISDAAIRFTEVTDTNNWRSSMVELVKLYIPLITQVLLPKPTPVIPDCNLFRDYPLHRNNVYPLYRNNVGATGATGPTGETGPTGATGPTDANIGTTGPTDANIGTTEANIGLPQSTEETVTHPHAKVTPSNLELTTLTTGTNNVADDNFSETRKNNVVNHDDDSEDYAEY